MKKTIMPLLNSPRNHLLVVIPVGLFLSFWLARPFFLLPANSVHLAHDVFTYVGRLLEFRDLLGSGYYSPQWCTNFRGGLGSPYFSYYQPGFFYVASLIPWTIAPVKALGITIMVFANFGYWGTYSLLVRRFGWISASVGACTILLSVYTCTEIFIRGDLSEFAGMMWLAPFLCLTIQALDKRSLKALVMLAFAGAFLVVLHPLIALVGYIGAILVLIFYFQGIKSLKRVLPVLIALGLGAGMSAFYWLPVFFEWNLVNPEQAFTGPFNYTNHFIDPLNLLSRYTRETLIPFTLGPLIPALVIINSTVAFWRWRSLDNSQQRLIVFSLGSIVIFTFLMTPASAPIWEIARPLQRLQFPWRIFSIVSVLAGFAAGCQLIWFNRRVHALLAAFIVLVLFALSFEYTTFRLDSRFSTPANAHELLNENFAPDLRNEWLPITANANVPMSLRSVPIQGPGVIVSGFKREQGLLTCQVRTDQSSFVILPHYYFPVGWSALFQDSPIALKHDHLGLMKVELPANTEGELLITFHGTPMRKIGLWVAFTALLITIGLYLSLRNAYSRWSSQGNLT
jgi:hypothetical protein